MGTSISSISEADRKKLEEQAELEFPMPINPCAFSKARIAWYRENWVNDQINKK